MIDIAFINQQAFMKEVFKILKSDLSIFLNILSQPVVLPHIYVRTLIKISHPFQRKKSQIEESSEKQNE